MVVRSVGAPCALAMHHAIGTERHVRCPSRASGRASPSQCSWGSEGGREPARRGRLNCRSQVSFGVAGSWRDENDAHAKTGYVALMLIIQLLIISMQTCHHVTFSVCSSSFGASRISCGAASFQVQALFEIEPWRICSVAYPYASAPAGHP